MITPSFPDSGDLKVPPLKLPTLDEARITGYSPCPTARHHYAETAAERLHARASGDLTGTFRIPTRATWHPEDPIVEDAEFVSTTWKISVLLENMDPTIRHKRRHKGTPVTYRVGMEAEVLRTDGSWTPCTVTAVDPEETVTVETDDKTVVKRIKREKQLSCLRVRDPKVNNIIVRARKLLKAVEAAPRDKRTQTVKEVLEDLHAQLVDTVSGGSDGLMSTRSSLASSLENWNDVWDGYEDVAREDFIEWFIDFCMDTFQVDADVIDQCFTGRTPRKSGETASWCTTSDMSRGTSFGAVSSPHSHKAALLGTGTSSTQSFATAASFSLSPASDSGFLGSISGSSMHSPSSPRCRVPTWDPHFFPVERPTLQPLDVDVIKPMRRRLDTTNNTMNQGYGNEISNSLYQVPDSDLGESIYPFAGVSHGHSTNTFEAVDSSLEEDRHVDAVLAVAARVRGWAQT